MFTPEEWKQIEKIPKDQLEALILDMTVSAKRELFKFITARTGVIPPNDYMLTHKHEFETEWAACGRDHSISGVWTWKGQPVVRQSGKVTFDGKNLRAEVRTEAFSAAQQN